MRYVYAVCASSTASASGNGLQDQPLRVVVAGDLAAVVSDLEHARPDVSEAQLWAHERVVERLMGAGPTLPMRFGSVLDDDGAVAELLHRRSAELSAALQRVSGAIELGIRAAWADEEPSGQEHARDASGADYMHGLLRRRRRASELAECVHVPLSALARARRERLLVTPRPALSAAYLVDQERVDEFRARVTSLEHELGQAQIICTGPWPPYSFVGAGGEAPR